MVLVMSTTLLSGHASFPVTRFLPPDNASKTIRLKSLVFRQLAISANQGALAMTDKACDEPQAITPAEAGNSEPSCER